MFKVGEIYKTRDGRRVRILATDIKGTKYPIVAAVRHYNGEDEGVATYTAEGRHMLEFPNSYNDLMPPTPVAYVNVYQLDSGVFTIGRDVHRDVDAADESARKASLLERVGRIKIEGTPGRYDR